MPKMFAAVSYGAREVAGGLSGVGEQIPLSHVDQWQFLWVSTDLCPLLSGRRTKETHVSFRGLGRGIEFRSSLPPLPGPTCLAMHSPFAQFRPLLLTLNRLTSGW